MALRMMVRSGLIGVLVLLMIQSGFAQQVADNTLVTDNKLIALCYHDVRDDVDGHLDADAAAVGSRQLAEQFEWLRQNGYTPVSVDQLEDARQGKRPLPPRAVLLSFDDGYESFYTRVFPLLKLYQYPAVMALVGSWLDISGKQLVQYGSEKRKRNGFLSVKQIREMQSSGLVEFASHTYDLHKGILANPQGNEEPAVISRHYDAMHHRYETEEQAYSRVLRDFRRSGDSMRKLTGITPRVMVWPYGAWNVPAEQAAREMGFQWFLQLGDNVAGQRVPTDGRIGRQMLVSNPTLADFKEMVQPAKSPVMAQRAAHVDLDYVYDADPVRLNANLDALLNRIKRLNISTVYLQAFADPDGDGNASAVYFPNRYLPVRADLFNRVAWQLRTRANVAVYAWMPVLAFDFGKDFYREHGVRKWQAQGSPVVSNSAYRRLSLFDSVARQRIVDMYSDLAAHAAFQGVLFHDDALLDMDEDFHPAAMTWFFKQGFPLGAYAQWKDNAMQRKQFTALKVRALDGFTQDLANAIKVYRPDIRTARNFYAETALNPGSADWFAQRLDTAFVQYDHVALMAMPWMENAKQPEQWAQNLIKQLAHLSPVQRQRLVVELQTRDWRNGKAISNQDFSRQVQLWSQAGYLNFAWYPDDFIANVPDFNTAFKALSLQDFPYNRR